MLHLHIDNFIGLFGRFLACALTFLDNITQIIDGIQVDIFQLTTSGSISRGMAISTMNIGLCLRCLSALSTMSLLRTGYWLAVDEIIISASLKCAGNSDKAMP